MLDDHLDELDLLGCRRPFGDELAEGLGHCRPLKTYKRPDEPPQSVAELRRLVELGLEEALQTGLRAVLAANTNVTSLVPAASILDRNSRPAPNPSIVIGEDQVIEHGDLSRRAVTVTSTLHVWKEEPSTIGVKSIAAAVRAALQAARPSLGAGYHCGDCRVSSARYLRDPDGETSHGVVTVESLVSEVS